MRIFLMSVICLASLMIAPLTSFGIEWNIGISGGSGGLNGFSLSVGEYYRAPEREIIVIRERGISEEELPVVFFIAQKARVSPKVIVDLRLRGMNWMDITLHHRLSPEIYYVPVRVAKQGPPYGNAYGYYKRHPKKEWKKIVLNDEDIVNQVNLKFISAYHGYAPERVIEYRSQGRNFVTIDRDIRNEKHGGDKGKNGKEEKHIEKHEKKGHWKEKKNNR